MGVLTDLYTRLRSKLNIRDEERVSTDESPEKPEKAPRVRSVSLVERGQTKKEKTKQLFRSKTVDEPSTSTVISTNRQRSISVRASRSVTEPSLTHIVIERKRVNPRGTPNAPAHLRIRSINGSLLAPNYRSRSSSMKGPTVISLEI